MAYPSSVTTFTTKLTGDVIQAAHVNDLQTEITAIETALLGTITHAVTIGNTLAVTGKVTLTSTSPQIFLNNTTSNWVEWGAFGLVAPTFSTRSAGTKLVLYPNIGASSVDFALGVEISTLWFSVPTTAEAFKWYGGTTGQMTLSTKVLNVGLGVGTPFIDSNGNTGIFGIRVLSAGTPQIQLVHNTPNAGGILHYNAVSGSLSIGDVAGSYIAAQFDVNGDLLLKRAIITDNMVTATLANGNNNDFAPTGHARATVFRLSSTSDTQAVLTGLAGGINGRRIVIAGDYRVDDVGVSSNIAITYEDTNSTASNRFTGPVGSAPAFNSTSSAARPSSAEFIYDGGILRWVRVN